MKELEKSINKILIRLKEEKEVEKVVKLILELKNLDNKKDFKLIMIENKLLVEDIYVDGVKITLAELIVSVIEDYSKYNYQAKEKKLKELGNFRRSINKRYWEIKNG